MFLPERPAAYVRVIGARNVGDPRVREQSRAVLAAARQRGWPRPSVYADIGQLGWDRYGSALSRLAGHLASGRHDAVIVADLSRISRDPADVLAFTVHCARCAVPLEAVDEGSIDESRIAVLYARRPVITSCTIVGQLPLPGRRGWSEFAGRRSCALPPRPLTRLGCRGGVGLVRAANGAV